MKKMLLSLVVFTTLSGYTLLAADKEGDNRKAEQTLKKEFADARNISWNTLANKTIFQASFTVNDQRLNAFFNEDGELVATGRYIESPLLPLLVSQALREKYDQFTVNEIIELVYDGETSYVISLENSTRKITAQAYTNGAIYTIKKVKKNSAKL